jgi:hypothetical protein
VEWGLGTGLAIGSWQQDAKAEAMNSQNSSQLLSAPVTSSQASTGVLRAVEKTLAYMGLGVLFFSFLYLFSFVQFALS